MKPSFALTFANDMIGLLHRTPSGWLSIGTVAQDDPDLTEALGLLRSSALELEPQGVTTKVVVPNSEILYSTVHAPGPKAAQRRAQIAAALDGQTPYDLSELAFDWSGTGDMVHVAAVARETLAQAEAFAVEHGFNPVSFVAMPDPGGFAAEPWFGLTDAAPTIVAEGDKVVRDQDPIRVVSALPPVADNATLDEPQVEEDATGAPTNATGDADLPATDSDEDQGPPPSPAASPPDAPAPADQPDPGAPEPAPPPADPVPEPAPDPVPSVPESPPADPAPVPEPVAVPPVHDPLPEPEPEMVPPATDPQPQPAPQELPPDPVPEAPMIEDVDPVHGWQGETDPDPLASAKAALAASLTPKAPDVSSAPVSSGWPARLGVSTAGDDVPPAPAKSVLRAAAAARSDRGAAPALSDKVQKALGKSSRTAKGKSKAPVARPVSAPPPPPLPPSATQPNVPHPKSEAEAMTVFGQRQARIGGKPRFLGLALTALLLVILLVVAVWAAMVLDAPQDAALSPEPEAEVIAADPAPDSPADPDVTEPATATASAEDPAPETLAATIEPEPVAAPEPEAESTPTTETATPDPAPAGADAALDVATSVRGPDGGDVEELTLPLPDQALDATPRARLAATSAANADLPPSAPVVLPAYGALYQFDAEGNILPTAEGVITPDGVRLVAGRPAIIPPARPETDPPAPASVTPEPEPDAASSAPAEIVIAPTEPPPSQPPEVAGAFQPDDTVARSRPRTRPAGLAPEPAPETGDPAAQEGALPAFTDEGTGFASRRPPTRPAAIAAAASAAAEAEQTRRLAEAAAAAAAAASTAAQIETVSALAPTRRPPARPANFSSTVQTVVAAAVAQPRVAPAVASRSDDAFDDGEPDTPRAAPSIPTRASVARQATVTGALNLGRINLIGVFGTSNSRYALVRESSGRLVRVKVGDRLDGGRVVAIGQADLSYQRGSNTVRLAMPRT